MFKKLLSSITEQKSQERRAELYRSLIRREAKIGGQLFGPVPAGHRREFFCLDEYTWVWHEEWIDDKKKRQIKTTRYDVRPTGVIKVQDGRPSQYISRDEAKNLYRAASQYVQSVSADYAAFL